MEPILQVRPTVPSQTASASIGNYALTKEDLQRYHDEGVVVVRSVFTPEEIGEMRAACDELVEKAREFTADAYIGTTYFNLMRECDPFDARVGQMPQLRGILRRVTYPYAVSSVIDRFRTHPALLGAVASLLGQDVVQIVNQVNFNQPSIGTGWGWHQDYRFRRKGLSGVNENFVQCLMALDPSSEANGGFRYVPGSFRLGRLTLDLDTTHAERFFDVSKIETPVLVPGDMVMFNALIIHGSTANRSTSQRRVFINGYAKRSACKHGKPVLARGQVVTHAPEDMEFEGDRAKLPLAAKY